MKCAFALRELHTCRPKNYKDNYFKRLIGILGFRSRKTFSKVIDYAELFTVLYRRI